MDYLGILQDHLEFIERFYNRAVAPFEDTIRKIETGEEPFVYRGEVGDGSEFLSEWQEAYNGLGVLGNCCLGLIEKSLHDYLREFVLREAGVLPSTDLSLVLKPYQGKGWFDRLCNFLEQKTQFKWKASPVCREQIEQINLSRNDSHHHDDIGIIRPRQSDRHFAKYPVSRFAEEWERKMFSQGKDDMPIFPLTINITRENLFAAISDVRQFSIFVEAQRTRW